MPERRDPPPTDEGWFALHDFRTVDWDAWEGATERDRERALAEGVSHLRELADVTDAEAGATAIYSVLGHKADLLLVHLRPTTAHLDAIERRFETTDLARFTEQTTSYVSVTEASGYSERARAYFEGEIEDNSGLANYIRSRLHPTVPDAEHVCFYPMDKRREPDQNWYALPFDERAEHMDAHGDIGRDYAGRVTQMITGSIGLDDWEWGVTLWADDLVDVKNLLYEMRFDSSTAEFAEFGSFYVGRKIAPTDVPALLAGEVVPSAGDTGVSPAEAAARDRPADSGGATGVDAGQEGEADGASAADSAGPPPGVGSDGGAGPPPAAVGGDESGTSGPETTDAEDMTARLATLGLHEGAAFEPDQFGVICYSEADARELAAEVDDLREQFDHYDTHVETAVRAQAGRSAVASVWETERAAGTAAGFLVELPGVGDSVSGPLGNGVGAPADADTGAGAESEAGAEAETDTSTQAEASDDADTSAPAGTGSAAAGAGAGVDQSDADQTDATQADTGTTDADTADTGTANADAADAGTADAEDGAGDASDSTGDDAAAAETDETSGTGHGTADTDSIREALADVDVYAGRPHGEDVYALVCYSSADLGDLTDAVSDLSDGFDRYDTHEGTDVYVADDGDTAAVVSLWTTEAAADTASEFLTDLPGIVGWADDREGFGTMGMFYTVKPEHREDFVETFAEVGEVLADMDGHRETALLANVEDENDMFIASQWDSQDDAMAFFRSEAFSDTVEWGRDVLADRPRHVFLA